jgi:hypothetical protein
MLFEQINQKHKGSEHQQRHDQACRDDEQPVLPRMLPLVLLVADEQVVVAAICLPGYVRHIPDDRYGTKGVLDGQVEHHAKYRDARYPTFPCGKSMKRGATAARASPIPGIQPMSASKPKRMRVPGISNRSSNQVAIKFKCSSEVALVTENSENAGCDCGGRISPRM